MSTPEYPEKSQRGEFPMERDESSSLATRYTKQLLGKKIVCTLDDGRTVRGTFICIDRLSNIILTKNVVEERMIDTADYAPYAAEAKLQNRQLPVKRYLGQAMIQGSRLVKVELEQSVHEEIMDSIQG
jgi:small nuclear ribonucleoprotein (snRNP)-like protein